jgi:hypothetical protein
MAENGGGGGPAPFLAFLLGGLLVAFVVVGFFAYNGHSGNAVNVPSHLSLNVKNSSKQP